MDRVIYLPQPYQREPDEAVTCPTCGRGDDPDARYCDQCGNAIPGGPQAPYVADAADTVQCPNDKAMNDPDASYCDQCGLCLVGKLLFVG